MKRSKHSLSHYNLLSADMGYLYPVGLVEVMAGDSIQHSTSALIRCAPMLAPVMHPVHARIHHWFVPFRLIWEDWENFITGGPDGTDASEFPTIASPASTGFAVGSLADYLGVPPGVADLPVSALPFRAYNLISNEWYRDPDLQGAQTIDLSSGVDTTTNVNILRACWEKDYFTSARLTPQKGPAVTLPLGTSAPVVSDGNLFAPTFMDSISGGVASQLKAGADAGTTAPVNVDDTVAGDSLTWSDPGLEVDLTSATAATIAQLREAFAIQRYQEARSRYGSRYTEYLRYLGVKSSDARLQRPEYLGGGKQTIQFSEVVQSSPGTFDSEETPTGTLAGHGIGAMRSNRYRRFFEEHGFIITCLSVKPKTMYASGLNRLWNRRSKEDFWQKELERIGQQEVLYKEVNTGHDTPDATFGYQDRYDEYRRMESRIAGEFRTTLDHWHFARIFTAGATPSLNSAFVRAEPTERVFADDASNTLYVMANHSIQARRLISAVGTPGGF